jgi:hypothetical protein
MPALRSSAGRPASRELDARAAAVALTAALAVALAALVIVLVTSSGGTEPVRVTPSALPPSPAERDLPAGLSGPGMRP